jgi:hypothetical protein
VDGGHIEGCRPRPLGTDLNDELRELYEAAVANGAAVALAGIDPMHYLHAADEEERRLLLAIAKRVIELEEIRQDNLVAKIGKLLGG